MDRPMNGPTNGWSGTPSYRDARTHLKIQLELEYIIDRPCLKNHKEVPSSFPKPTDFVRQNLLMENQVQHERFLTKKSMP